MNKSPTERSISAMTRYEKSISGMENKEFLLGKNTSRIYFEDPKLLLFTLSRYKFVSKMFAGRKRVLEIGCQEGFGSQLVSKTVKSLHCIDFYHPHIESCNRRFCSTNVNMTFECADILDGLENPGFDGAFALDVLEHIDPVDEDRFLKAILSVLTPASLVIIGMPSLESQTYASARSREGHVNCKRGDELRGFLEKYLLGVTMFSMNDEVLHTGFFPMSQYIFGVGWYSGG